jgi:hypothetical protein
MHDLHLFLLSFYFYIHRHTHTLILKKIELVNKKIRKKSYAFSTVKEKIKTQKSIMELGIEI